MSQSLVHRIFRYDLKMKPYHISVHQGLTPENALQRRTMCAWFLRQVREEEDFLRSLWFSDEAHFHLSGTVNSRNYVHWASERPDEVIERILHVPKATACVALSAQGVIGPFGLLQLIDICMCLLTSGEHWDGSAAMNQEVSSGSCRTEPLLIRQDGS